MSVYLIKYELDQDTETLKRMGEPQYTAGVQGVAEEAFVRLVCS